ncbi:MAG TPA: hypothetical protein EYP73_01745 [Acidimicrobiia bacterium]|nr:hypothetical protein [Acidimicrobiia bacterium]
MKEPTPRPGLFGGVRSPVTIRKFLVVTGLIALGGGFTLRLANVFFQEGVDASENVIGVTFAAGSLFLAAAAFAAPLVERRLGKVRSVVFSRLAAIPFIVVIGLAPGMATPTAVISLAGTAFVLRTMLFNMSGPIYEAFSMELLHPGERATFTGLETLLAGGLAAVGGWFGASLMNGGDFASPWLAMAALYLVSVVAFWAYFRDHDRPGSVSVTVGSERYG